MIQALRDEVVVQPLYEQSKSSIIIPKSALKYRQYDGQVYGKVLSVGSRHRLNTKIGDVIVWQRHEGKKIVYEGQVYFAVRERWVLGRINA